MRCGYCGEPCDGDSGVSLGADGFVPLHHAENPIVLAPNGVAISGYTGRPVFDQRLRDSCYDLVTVENRPLMDGRRFIAVCWGEQELPFEEDIRSPMEQLLDTGTASLNYGGVEFTIDFTR